MNKSLQDQLLNAGLIDKKKAKQIDKTKRKEKNQKRRSKDNTLNETQEAIIATQKAKHEKDLALNKKRLSEAEEKALVAQVKQLAEHYRVKNTDGEKAYHFEHNKKIKTLYVNARTADELTRGRLCIIWAGTTYIIVPKPIAERIMERKDEAVVVNNAILEKSAEHSPESDEAYYAQFEIPDDLDW